MFEAIREDKQVKVIFKGVDNCSMTVCTIPYYYKEDLGVATVIANVLNEQDKYVMNLEV